MKKKITLALLLVLMLACVFALTAGATEVDPNAEYYDKVYTDANGDKFPIYEKVGDTYYPLVWFAYEEGEGDAAVTKYVKVHFEDCTTLSHASGQGRLNGVSYTYTKENGEEKVLNASNIVVLNLRDGFLDGGQAIKTFERRGSDPAYSKVEAIYLPLTFSGTFGYGFSLSTLRVLDFDKNHTTPVTIQQHIIDGTKIEEFFVPGCATFSGNGQFQNCASLEKIVFGAGFNGGTEMMPYTFANANNLKMVCYLGDEVSVNTNSNGVYHKMTKLSYREYTDLEDKSGKYIIVNCSPCLAFNGDVHTASDDKVIIGDDYFAPMQIACPCAVEGCTATMNVGTIPALFTWKGYSVSTFADKNGNYSVAQWFGIDIEAVKEYSLYYTDFELGVAAAIGIDHPVSVVDGAVVYDENAVCAPISTNVDGAIEIKYSYFEIKVTGIPGADSEIGDQRDTAIAFNGYVVAGGAVKYIHFGATYDKAQSASYNSLINE